MIARVRRHWWLPIALLGVGGLWLVSATFNFSHAYILAGGSDNPLGILTGNLPRWEPIPLGVGIASACSDVVKGIAGFILFAAICNRSLRWHVRAGTIVLALVLVSPTFVWSFRSAIGMAALAFGDTIAQRQATHDADQKIVTGISASMEAAAIRAKFLAQQTTCTRKGECSRHTRDFNEVQKQLKSERDELRSQQTSHRAIGAGDPGGAVIAAIAGWAPERVTQWTIAAFILMLEIGSTLGLPAINLATRLHAPPEPPEEDEEKDEADDLEQDDAQGAQRDTSHYLPARELIEERVRISAAPTPAAQVVAPIPNLSESKEKKASVVCANDVKSAQMPLNDVKSEKIAFTDNSADEEEPTDDPDYEDDGVFNFMDPADQHRRDKEKRAKRRGRKPHAEVRDGHFTRFWKACKKYGHHPGSYKTYEEFCNVDYKVPMGAEAFAKEKEKFRRVEGRSIVKNFDVGQGSNRKASAETTRKSKIANGTMPNWTGVE